MEHKVILYPMFVLIMWTFIMAILMIYRAVKAVKNGLNPNYFQYGTGYDAPGSLRAIYLHYANLFEMPVLYYIAILTLFITHIVNSYLLWVSWAYVFIRVIHSLLSISNKYLARRRDSFLISSILLLMIWIEVINKTVFN